MAEYHIKVRTRDGQTRQVGPFRSKAAAAAEAKEYKAAGARVRVDEGWDDGPAPRRRRDEGRRAPARGRRAPRRDDFDDDADDFDDDLGDDFDDEPDEAPATTHAWFRDLFPKG